jgi:hypothetical protein
MDTMDTKSKFVQVFSFVSFVNFVVVAAGWYIDFSQPLYTLSMSRSFILSS